MSCDRFVYFKKRIPTFQEVKMVLEDYLGDWAEIEDNISNNISWLGIKLNSKQSWPFQRLEPDLFPLTRGLAGASHWIYGKDKNRAFEVFYRLENDEASIDVVTRLSDELVSNIAWGFARLCARYWEGKCHFDSDYFEDFCEKCKNNFIEEDIDLP